MSKPVPLTPIQASEWLDSLPPIEIKLRLVDYLRWQAAHGKRILHGAHYFRVVKYGYQPRASTMAKQGVVLRDLTKTIGRTI